MNILMKNLTVTLLGGYGYCLVEMIWRGRTHYTMFFAGAITLLVFYNFNKYMNFPLVYKAIFGALFITLIEFTIGVIFNRDFAVWNYSNMPLNLEGQICVPFTILWFFLSGAVFFVLEKVQQYSEKTLA